MKDRDKFIARFSSFKPELRLGNLASNLSRLGYMVSDKHGDQAELEMMREIAWMFELLGPSATLELADMQREICRWRNIWPVEETRSLLAFRARKMSERVLELSGLLTSR